MHEVFFLITVISFIAKSDMCSFKKSFCVRNQVLTVLLADILKVVLSHQEVTKEAQILMKASRSGVNRAWSVDWADGVVGGVVGGSLIGHHIGHVVCVLFVRDPIHTDEKHGGVVLILVRKRKSCFRLGLLVRGQPSDVG